MKSYLGLAAFALSAVEVDAMSRHKEAYLEQVKGINMEVLHGSVGWVASKSEKMLFQKKRQA
jgi:hypothetical protein